MRTTIRLDDDLLIRAKQLAVATGRSFTRVIEDCLREVLGRKQAKSRSRPVRLPTVKGRGLQPGVDLDHNAALLDLMDGVGR